MGIFSKLITGGGGENAHALKWAMDKLAKAKQRRDADAEAAVKEAEEEVRQALESEKEDA